MAKELPVVESCALDEDGLRTQGDRYRRLAGSVTAAAREGDELVVSFGAAVDRGLLAEAVAVERECCPFFVIAVEAGPTLRVGVDDPARLPALEAIARAHRALRPARRRPPVPTLRA